MSTEINIKKRIDIQEEGVSITPDVNSINFTGAGVTASATGNDVTVDIVAASGTVLYYMNETVTQAPYKEFSSTGTTAVQQVIPATVAGGATATIASYQTASGVPGSVVIPQGLWQLFLHFNATTAGQNWIIRPYVYKRDLGGIETLIFTPDPEIVTNMSTTTQMYTCDGVIPTTTLLTTDRIVVKINVQNTTGVSHTVNFRTEGSQHYSCATTTLNQVIPTGAVTSVTGTAPVVSSGGTTPAISMAAANGSTNGYLTSTDWSTFNGKQNAITLTTTGTSGAATLVGSTLNVPQYAGGLTYFTEAQNTSAPNATVPVDSLTALSATTNADVSIVPKGAGSFMLDVPDNNVTGGSKRGSYSVDLQMSRLLQIQVVSGNYSFAAGADNRVDASYATSLGQGCIVTNNWATAIGRLNTASGDSSVALGFNSTASNNRSVAIGETCSATGISSVAIGATNTVGGTYGVGIGYLNTATDSSTALGRSNTVSSTLSAATGNGNTHAAGATYSFSVGRDNIVSAAATNSFVAGYNNTVSADKAVSIGSSNASSGSGSVSIGNTLIASGNNSLALGLNSSTQSVNGKQAYASGRFLTNGDAQKGLLVLRAATPSDTPTTLTSDAAVAAATNQLFINTFSTIRFKGTIVGRAQGGGASDVGVWDIDGVMSRAGGNNSLTIGNVNLVTNPAPFGTPTLAVDTVNKTLRVQVTGLVGVPAQWVATIETTEVIYV